MDRARISSPWAESLFKEFGFDVFCDADDLRAIENTVLKRVTSAVVAGRRGRGSADFIKTIMRQ